MFLEEGRLTNITIYLPHLECAPLLKLWIWQETEKVARELFTYSQGQIKTGVYHADVKDSQKEELHIRWRKGEIKVVCATIGENLRK